jgi:hypothetical protein
MARTGTSTFFEKPIANHSRLSFNRHRLLRESLPQDRPPSLPHYFSYAYYPNTIFPLPHNIPFTRPWDTSKNGHPGHFARHEGHGCIRPALLIQVLHAYHLCLSRQAIHDPHEHLDIFQGVPLSVGSGLTHLCCQLRWLFISLRQHRTAHRELADGTGKSGDHCQPGKLCRLVCRRDMGVRRAPYLAQLVAAAA